ncbi:MAG TPA: ABC transporter substrate-binding protein [Stellaceae bacterium]|jgi:branched-chain amino acid transport system substrate-binding protein
MRIAFAVLGLIVGIAAGAIARAQAAEPYVIHVILPLTGNGAFLGEGHRASLDTLADIVNKSNGIDGRPLRFVYHDDQSSPQVSVQLAAEIIAEKPAVILGSSLVAMCAAMAPLMQNGPVDYCLSPAYHPPAGSFVFSSASSAIDQTAAVIRYFRLKGWTRIATLANTDATGQANDKAVDEIVARPENKGVTLVAREHFNPTDLSVTAQIERIRAANAQAVIAGVTGTAAATVFKGMVQTGFDIPVEVTSGNESFPQMLQWQAFLPKGLVMSSALFPEHDGILTLDPRIETAQHAMYAALAARGVKADNMEATSWDAALIVVAALRSLGPDATADQLRRYIAGLKDFAGVDGIYDFTANPERGLGPESSTVVRYDADAKAWQWLAQPGGVPLH